MLTVYAIPAFNDNYFWLLQPDTSNQLVGIIITHHHHDHIDGVNELTRRYPVPVYGPRSAKIPQVTHFLTDGDQLRLPSLTLQVLAVPGHTLDHIAYLYRPDQQQDDRPDKQQKAQPDNQAQANGSERAKPASLFCGDTLFAGGCGRLFDGTASQLYDSLMRLAELDDATLVYCAHEYTLANLKFARVVEPGNINLVERLQQVTQMRQQGLMTLPTTIGLEKQTNPYLRVKLMPIKQAAERHSGQSLPTPREVFAAIRIWKDYF
jgi:hydroxyacylglutathione hydrolase